MQPLDVVNAYFEQVYTRRDADAVRIFVADPCLRHEHGELVTKTLDANVARVAALLDQAPDLRFDTPALFGDGEYVTAVFNLRTGGRTLSGIEVFRVQGGRITETWNSAVQPAAWG
jgi:predicted SnoaL-like aldol condensation-catalyzing enzyme